MPSITKEQVDSTNAKCSNGWKLDVEYYLSHGEKTLIKCVTLDEKNYLEFTIRYNYKNQISLHISKFYHEKGDYFASTHGMGKNKVLNEIQAKRKSVNNLIEFTRTLTDEVLRKINNDTEVAKGEGLILQSEDF